jgi:hypothetical protein
VGTLSVHGQQEGVMSISLDNAVEYTAFQMDITLPTGVNIDDIVFTERATSTHQLSFNTIAEGKVRVIGWSAQNAPIRNNSGELIKLILKSSETEVAAELVNIDNVTFVATNGAEHKLAPVGAFGQTTGITGVEDNDVDQHVYDLQGRRITTGRKGLYIIKGQKNVMKLCK